MKDSRTPRLLVLAGFLAAVLLAYLGVLYNTQVLQHEDYLARSLHSIAKEETIDASRGIITDRKGRTLVSNDSVYDLTFDTSLLKADQDQNEAILRLLELCREEGLTWTDNLPISDTAPYLYKLEAMSSAQRSRFLTYVKSLKKASSLLGAYLLGPVYGAEAVGVGPALADLLGGYGIYVPATLVIKALMGLTAAVLYQALHKKGWALIVCGVVAEAIMVVGYALFDGFLAGNLAVGLTGIPSNLVQAAFGLAASTLLALALRKSSYVRKQFPRL